MAGSSVWAQEAEVAQSELGLVAHPPVVDVRGLDVLMSECRSMQCLQPPGDMLEDGYCRTLLLPDDDLLKSRVARRQGIALQMVRHAVLVVRTRDVVAGAFNQILQRAVVAVHEIGARRQLDVQLRECIPAV